LQRSNRPSEALENISNECLHVAVMYVTISPSHRNTSMTTTDKRRTHMNTQISTKLAALAVALMMNSVIIGGVAYLFNGQLRQHAGVPSLVQASAAQTRLV